MTLGGGKRMTTTRSSVAGQTLKCSTTTRKRAVITVYSAVVRIEGSGGGIGRLIPHEVGNYEAEPNAKVM